MAENISQLHLNAEIISSKVRINFILAARGEATE